MADFALLTDGSQNYLSLGTLGTFGSNLGSGFYISFDIQTTNTAIAEWGFSNGAGQLVITVGLNENSGGGVSSGKIRLFFRDTTAKVLAFGLTNASTFNDGNKHTVVITAIPGTNTGTITLDGVVQTINYNTQGTPVSFANLTRAFYIGARDNAGTADTFGAVTVDNINIGTSSSTLFGSYNCDEGTGTVLTDASGNSNNGSLQKGAGSYPSWVTGISTTIALTGTITSGVLASDIVAGGKTIILTITGDQWVASGATFDAQRQTIINGLVSSGSELHGWNNEVKAKIAVTDVVRTSSTVATITLDAESAYSITANETITATIPATALLDGIAVVAAPTFTITAPTLATHKPALGLVGVG